MNSSKYSFENDYDSNSLIISRLCDCFFGFKWVWSRGESLY